MRRARKNPRPIRIHPATTYLVLLRPSLLLDALLEQNNWSRRCVIPRSRESRLPLTHFLPCVMVLLLDFQPASRHVEVNNSLVSARACPREKSRESLQASRVAFSLNEWTLVRPAARSNSRGLGNCLYAGRLGAFWGGTRISCLASCVQFFVSYFRVVFYCSSSL